MSVERARRRRAARNLATAEKAQRVKLDAAIAKYKPRCPKCRHSFVAGDSPKTCRFCQYNFCAECIEGHACR